MKTHHVITFSFTFYHIFFVYNVIEISCFFPLEEVADAFCRPSVLIETPAQSWCRADWTFFTELHVQNIELSKDF